MSAQQPTEPTWLTQPAPGQQRRRGWIPALVLVIGLLSSAVTATLVGMTTRSKELLRFQSEVERTREAIESRLDTYLAMLRGTQGLFASSEEVTWPEFRVYISHLRLATRLPGTRGIGYSTKYHPEEAESLIARQRAEGFPDFRLWPAGTREEYHANIYIEPLDWRNQRAIGFDMFTDPVCRVAMQRARDTGLASATGKLRLVQETDEDPQAGFVIFLPVYQPGAIPDTISSRRAKLRGFVYTPFRVDDLLGGIFAGEGQPGVAFRLFDREAVPENLLHDSQQANGSTSAAEGPGEARVEMVIAGRTWVLLARPGPGYIYRSPTMIWLMTCLLGLVVSLLLYGVTGWLARARSLAERSVMEMRAQEAERRKAEAALRESEELFRATFNQAAAGIVLLTPEGNFERVNRRFCEITGYRSDELIERPWRQLAHADDQATGVHFHRRILAGESPDAPLEMRVVCKDGRVAWVSVSTALVRNEAGEPQHTVSVVRDITAHRQAERTILDQKHELEDFVSIVAHDLKHPVVSVQGLLGILRKDSFNQLDADGRENLEMALSECSRMKDIIAQLGHIARIGSAEVEMHPVRLDELLMRVVDRFGPLVEVRRAEVRVECPSITVKIARSQVEEALDNLVENALQYGCVGTNPMMILRGAAEGHVASICVEDNGPGIDPRFHQRIFEVFRRLDPQGPVAGTGVGLTAVQRLIRRIGGAVAIDSDIDHGARFTITFPAEPVDSH